MFKRAYYGPCDMAVINHKTVNSDRSSFPVSATVYFHFHLLVYFCFHSQLSLVLGPKLTGQLSEEVVV